MTDDLIKETDVAKIMDVHKMTLAAWRHEGRGPEYIKLGKNIRYRRSTIEKWLEDHTVTPRRAS